MALHLKSFSDIEDIIAGATFASVPLARKQLLAARMTAASAELDLVFPVLLGQAVDQNETAFMRALIVADSGSGSAGSDSTLPPSLGTGGKDFDGSITSIGDGAAASLEAVATVGIAVPALRIIYVDDTVQDWLLVAGTDATVQGQTQQPLDFDAATNAKVWVRKG